MLNPWLNTKIIVRKVFLKEVKLICWVREVDFYKFRQLRGAYFVCIRL